LAIFKTFKSATAYSPNWERRPRIIFFRRQSKTFKCIREAELLM
jgi:hypothetical protein